MCYNHVGLLPKYIAMCLYQVGKHQAAASAAFTNLVVNPEVSSILNIRDQDVQELFI